MTSTLAFLSFWGKARPASEQGPAWHPLAYHCLDVAATAQEYLRRRPRLLAELAQAFKLGSAEALAWTSFLAGAHDLGKFHPCFVAKQPELFRAIFPGRALPDASANPHPAVGLTSLLQYLHARWYQDMDFEDEFVEFIEPVANAAAGHHGRPQSLDAVTLGPTAPVAYAWLNALSDLLGVRLGIRPDVVDGVALRRASFELAGLITLCDWVGSNQVYFPYTPPQYSLGAYFELAQQRAVRALDELHLEDKPPSSRNGFEELFPEYAASPSPLQRYANSVPLNAQAGPVLFILEDETGAGKTEAAMTLASRLTGSGAAQGVLVSLPTQTTANSLFKRIAPLAGKLFDPRARPALSLAHGKGEYALRRLLSRDLREGDISGELHAWCTDSSKTALLADFGVCTVDQVVLSALPVKHNVLRQLGLGRKVLVVDEAHACEPYLMELLALTLRLHAQRGGSAIILSATLPNTEKLRLLRAFAEGAGHAVPDLVSSDAYPLATRLDGNGCMREPVSSSRGPRDLRMEPVRAAQVPGLIAQWLHAGDSVCLLLNTVRAAQRAYDQYSRSFPGQVELVHARFTARHRGDNDARLLERFGKTAEPAGRRGRLVIATQVAEQSLDVDFDQMVTDLAPLDALLQRGGRWRRHVRTAAGEFIPARSASDGRAAGALHVIMPPVAGNEAFIEQLSPFTMQVYDQPGVLYRTAQLVEQQRGLRLPCGVRTAMEQVYDAQAAVPAFLQPSDDGAQGRQQAERMRARYVRLDPDKGYSCAQPPVPNEECVTRLGEPSHCVVLCDDKGRPLFGDAEESGVAVRASLLALSVEEDGRTRLKMQPGALDRWYARAWDPRGRLRVVRYSRERGLSVSEPQRRGSSGSSG